MKTATQFFPLMMILFIISSAATVNAQGRGHHKGYEGKHHHKDRRHDRDDDHHRDQRYGHKHEHHQHHHERQVRHVVHYHDHYCSHAPVVVHHHPRPRYIYYRDYDVYYDMDRSVYISWSGRSWSVSANLPVVLHRVDRRVAVRMEVDYHHDDFAAYLETGRPTYRRVYAGM